MKVIYKQLKDNYYGVPTWGLVSTKPECCSEMGDALSDGYIEFGEVDRLSNTSDKLNIIKYAPYPEGAAFSEMSISFCPFCGEKIEYVVSGSA